MPSPNVAPLRHPAWWSALALLALNDHVLKGSGVLPTALTGKLSDFAGLIVAPVLLAALLGARTVGARAAAFAVVAVPFSAINLSPALAQAWDGWLGWSTTTDPSDLMALLVAPLAVALAGVERTGSAWMPRMGIAFGSLACIATSPVEPIPATSGGPILEHQSEEEVAVRVRWLDAAIDCDWLLMWMETGGGADELARALDPSLFDEARTYRLDPGQSADLTRPMESGLAGACDALILSADGLEPKLVAYSTTDWRDTRWGAGPGTLTLEPRRDGFRLAATGDLLLADPVPAIEPAMCDRATPVGTFSWSGTAPSDVIVRGYETFSDGCFAIELQEPRVDDDMRTDEVDPTDPPRLDPLPPETHELILCVPAEYVGFAVDERIEVRPGADHLQLIGDRESLTLERLRGLDPGAIRPLCEGARLPCGGYAEPIGWARRGERLSPGQPVRSETTPRPGVLRHHTTLLDDATRVVATHADCDLDVGARGVLLTHWEDER